MLHIVKVLWRDTLNCLSLKGSIKSNGTVRYAIMNESS